MSPATSTSKGEEDAKVLRSNVVKSLLKGTAAVAAITPFLQINPSTYVNYLIFLALCYALLGGYMFFKWTTRYIMDEEGIVIKRLLRNDISLSFTNVGQLSYAQGMLAKRLNCGSIFIELKKGKGNYRSLSGIGVFLLKDIPRPIEVYREISNLIEPFAATV
ncbi:MAG TPA: hypothetical protein VJR06_08665 [Nitrososphaerales archaeon]|nr:hypothetical protein [Nitrososphaerales archaeon]